MKTQLRASMLLQRKALAPLEVLTKSERIKRKLFSSAWYRDAKTILFYVSYDNEVRTHEMIQESLQIGKHIVVPKVVHENETIICSLLTRWQDLSVGSYQILEPRQDCVKRVSLDAIDLVVLPGVAFDCTGNRLGHGKGFYDKLLQNKTRPCRVGLAFEFQVVERIPAEVHDVKVECIITEKRIITCA